MSDQENILAKAGVRPHHRNYQKKLRQLHDLKISALGLEQLYELDAQVLNFLFMGTLSIANRYEFIDGMSGNWDLAVRALNMVAVDELVEVLMKIEERYAAQEQSIANSVWHELGSELAIGIEEDPLILFRRYLE